MYTKELLVLQEADFEPATETGEVLLTEDARNRWREAEFVMYRGCLVKNRQGENQATLAILRPQKPRVGQIVRVRGYNIRIGEVID